MASALPLKSTHLRQPPRLWAVLAFCLANSLALDASAEDCSGMPGNLVTNCGFDSEIPPWMPLFGSASHDPTDGYLAPGSALIEGGMTGNGFEIQFRQCITPVEPNVTYTFRAAIKGSEALPDSCALNVATRSEADCSGGGTFANTPIIPQADTWMAIPDNELTTSASTVAVRFEFRCVRAAENFSANVDDAYFGVPPIVDDGFESAIK